MSKFDERLYCSNCHIKFTPDARHFLRSNDDRFKSQLFMVGMHLECGKEFAAFLGINGKEVTYVRISLKKIEELYNRLDADLIKERAAKIDKAKHSQKRSKTVQGFKKEINSGKWMPQIQAVR